MKYSIFLLCFLVFLCVEGGKVDITPKMKVEVTKEVSCRKRSQNGDLLHMHYKVKLNDFRSVEYNLTFSLLVFRDIWPMVKNSTTVINVAMLLYLLLVTIT